jgi:hypothetical protein
MNPTGTAANRSITALLRRGSRIAEVRKQREKLSEFIQFQLFPMLRTCPFAVS